MTQSGTIAPGVTGIIRCGGCSHKLEADWAFCPTCGVDNRPPESRPRPPVHVHELKYGSHCVICGHLPDKGVATGRPIANGYAFARDWGYRWTGLLIFGSGVWFGIQSGWDQVSRITLIPTAVVGLIFALITSKTTLDLGRGRIEWSKGVLPFVAHRTLPLAEFMSIRLESRDAAEDGKKYDLFLIHSSGRKILVHSAWSSSKLGATGKSLSASLGIPYQDAR